MLFDPNAKKSNTQGGLFVEMSSSMVPFESKEQHQDSLRFKKGIPKGQKLPDSLEKKLQESLSKNGESIQKFELIKVRKNIPQDVKIKDFLSEYQKNTIERINSTPKLVLTHHKELGRISYLDSENYQEKFNQRINLTSAGGEQKNPSISEKIRREKSTPQALGGYKSSSSITFKIEKNLTSRQKNLSLEIAKEILESPIVKDLRKTINSKQHTGNTVELLKILSASDPLNKHSLLKDPKNIELIRRVIEAAKEKNPILLERKNYIKLTDMKAEHSSQNGFLKIYDLDASDQRKFATKEILAVLRDHLDTNKNSIWDKKAVYNPQTSQKSSSTIHKDVEKSSHKTFNQAESNKEVKTKTEQRSAKAETLNKAVHKDKVSSVKSENVGESLEAFTSEPQGEINFSKEVKLSTAETSSSVKAKNATQSSEVKTESATKPKGEIEKVEKLTSELSQVIEEAKTYLLGKEGALEGEEKFIFHLITSLEADLKSEESSRPAENLQLPVIHNASAFLANLARAGNEPQAFSKAINAILDFHILGMFENDKQGLRLLGNLHYQGETSTQQAKFIQLAISNLEVARSGLKPGQVLTTEQLQRLFGEQLHYIEMVPRAQKSNQVGEAAVSAESKMQDAKIKQGIVLSENGQVYANQENRIFCLEEDKLKKRRDHLEPANTPWEFLFRSLGLASIFQEIKKLSTHLIYFGLSSAAIGTLIFLILKLNES